MYFQFLGVLGLCCCTWDFSSCDEQGPLFIAVPDLLMLFEGFSDISKGEVLHEGEIIKRNELITLKVSEIRAFQKGDYPTAFPFLHTGYK